MKAILILLLMGTCCPSACFSQVQKLTELVATEDLLAGFTYQGVYYARKGDQFAARTALKSALHRSGVDNKNKDTCRYHLGLVCLMSSSKKQWAERLEHLRSIADPGLFEHYWENITIAYMLNRKFGEARISVRQADSLTAIPLLLNGLIQMEYKDYTSATRYFEKMEGLGEDLPFFAMAKVKYLGRNGTDQSWFDNVIKWLRIAGKNKKDSYAATLAGAIVHGESGKYSRALHLLKRLNPSDSAVQYATTLTYFWADKDSIAEKTLQRIVRAHPKFTDSHVLLGHVNVRKAYVKNNPDLWRAGIKHYSNAIKLDAKPEYYVMRALAWLRLFDYQKPDSDSCIVKALADFRHIKNERPNYEVGYESLLAEARAWHYMLYSLAYKKHQSGYFHSNDLPTYIANATLIYKKAIAKDSSRLDAIEGLGTLNKDIREHRASINYFLRAGAIRVNADNLMGVGMAYLEMDSLAQAGLYFRKTEAANPSNANAIMGQGLVLLRKPETETAGMQLIAKAYTMIGTVADDITKASIIFNFAFARTYDFRNSGYPQAAKGFAAYAMDVIQPIYREAEQITPLADSSVYFVNLGWYAEELKFPELAGSYYLRSQTVHASNNYAMLLAKNDKTSEAIAILEKIEGRLEIAKMNLMKIRDGKQHCPCLKTITFSYLNSAYQPQHIAPKLTNHFFSNGMRLSPVLDFYPLQKPQIVKKYGHGDVSRKKSDPMDCPVKRR
ncbi:tetratricopeptide repeat protein [Dyadobacter diqingensis]|uniref:tetratricopeptide repeat protein n=1 Tax=Dyadobacter diqingensis TaxID=2938121 RepID=UPI0020C1AC1E|nr:hypothetical protein [Dyadobacter diqingensis]